MAKKPPQAALAAKPPTDLHVGLTEYIKAQTGYEADAQSVSLAVRLTAEYRGSEANRKRRAERQSAAEREKAAVAARKREKAAARAKALREEAERLEREAGVNAEKPKAKRAPRKPKAETPTPVVEDTATKRAAAKARLSVVPAVVEEADDGFVGAGPEAEAAADLVTGNGNFDPDAPQTDISDAGDVVDDEDDDDDTATAAPVFTFASDGDDDLDDDDF